MDITDFPRYGEKIWCIDNFGKKSPIPLFPSIRAFYYEDKNGKPDGDSGFLLLEDFTIAYKIKDKWYSITCKNSFDWDGASIPRAMRSVIGDKVAIDILVGSLFHDLFYCSQTELIPRNIADEFIHDSIEAYNGTFIKADNVWLALRMFGSFAWKNDKKNKIKKYATYIVIKELSDDFS